MSTNYHDAIILSMLAHKSQVRKILPVPYWVHPTAVSSTVAEWGGSEVQRHAALLHDVIEDTTISYNTIREILDSDVAELVDDVSSQSDKSIPWKIRKISYINRFASYNSAGVSTIRADAFLLKLADMFCNLTSTLNDLMRTDRFTPSARTIDGYITLVPICLIHLESINPTQAKIAKHHLSTVIASVIAMMSNAEQLKMRQAYERHQDGTAVIDDPKLWIQMLKQVWLEADSADA